MKRFFSIFIILLSFTFGSVVNAVTVGYNPRTGDVWIDTELNEINRYGRSYGDYFINDMVTSYGAPRSVVHELYYERRWEPADIYYACAIAYFLQRPCLDVVSVYERDRGQGWGVIAQRLGIKPGSEAFHRLKDRVGVTSGKFKVYDQGQNNKSKSANAASAEHGNSKNATAPASPQANSAKDKNNPGNSEKAKDNGNGDQSQGNANGQKNDNGNNQGKGNSGKDKK